MSVSRYEELAREWLKVAANDLAYAKLGAREGFHAQACFVCQQVAEKSLKAYLFAQHQKLVRVHILPQLLDESKSFDPDFVQLQVASDVLTNYYTSTRYPDALFDPTAYDETVSSEAIQLAGDVLTFVLARVDALLGPEVDNAHESPVPDGGEP